MADGPARDADTYGNLLVGDNVNYLWHDQPFHVEELMTDPGWGKSAAIPANLPVILAVLGFLFLANTPLHEFHHPVDHPGKGPPHPPELDEVQGGAGRVFQKEFQACFVHEVSD